MPISFQSTIKAAGLGPAGGFGAQYIQWQRGFDGRDFIPLVLNNIAYTLIGGTLGGTVLTLVFLPALYAIWFKIKPVAKGEHAEPETRADPVLA